MPVYSPHTPKKIQISRYFCDGSTSTSFVNPLATPPEPGTYLCGVRKPGFHWRHTVAMVGLRLAVNCVTPSASR